MTGHPTIEAWTVRVIALALALDHVLALVFGLTSTPRA